MKNDSRQKQLNYKTKTTPLNSFIGKCFCQPKQTGLASIAGGSRIWSQKPRHILSRLVLQSAASMLPFQVGSPRWKFELRQPIEPTNFQRVTRAP